MDLPDDEPGVDASIEPRAGRRSLGGPALAFVAGAALGVVGWLMKRRLDGEVSALGLILLPGIFGTLGSLLRSVGKSMWKGQAGGLDERRHHTSRVVLFMAGLLFVPLWGVSLALTVEALSPERSMDRLAGCAACAAFSSALVLGIVREWRRVPTVQKTR